LKAEALKLDYPEFLAKLKQRILEARTIAVRTVNHELILLYWDIGQGIVQKQEMEGWGESVIDRLSADLKEAFPHSTGFSSRNLRDMKRFYLAYTDEAIWRHVVAKLDNSTSTKEFLRQLVAEIHWGHHLMIMNKLNDPAARLYYLRATAQFGWSRSVLLNQIKAGAYERAVTDKKTNNFNLALPEYFVEQANEMMKSRYNLEFLGIHQEVKERELENRLITHLQSFLLELGYGFCFIGRQYRLCLGTKEYYVDLLFYHRLLKCLVAFDLKVGAFEPEHSGKMDFYLNLLNDKERSPDDNPSIGIILCAEKDDIEVEFALKTKGNPIGVAEYQLQAKLPPEFNGRLPNSKQLTEAVRNALELEKKT
jgi:predicted nuclease of restriction endonuclease-like (RecB) superfamily